MDPIHQRWAHLLLRLYLGVNIALHGLVRLPKLSAFADGLVKAFAETPLPEGLVRTFAFTLAPLEVLIGAALLVGLRLRYTVATGMALMALLTFGMALREQWDVVGIQTVYALTYAAVLFTAPKDRA